MYIEVERGIGEKAEIWSRTSKKVGYTQSIVEVLSLLRLPSDYLYISTSIF
jgi:hypothetical protein